MGLHTQPDIVVASRVLFETQADIHVPIRSRHLSCTWRSNSRSNPKFNLSSHRYVSNLRLQHNAFYIQFSLLCSSSQLFCPDYLKLAFTAAAPIIVAAMLLKWPTSRLHQPFLNADILKLLHILNRAYRVPHLTRLAFKYQVYRP
jgi:hypothetical protein